LRDHIKILGILNIVMGGLTALGGVIVLVAMGGIAAIVALTLQGPDAEGARISAPILGIVGLAIGTFLLLLSLPSIVGGWGLLNYKSWARPLMIVLSGFHLLHVPLGTALGVYGLWVLLNEQTRQLLDSGGALPPPVTYPMPQPGFRPQSF
jgi:hypothetical protein